MTPITDAAKNPPYRVERRADGAVIVRVPSRQQAPAPLPDAVFAFRDGDPQYAYWAQILADQQRAAK